MYTTSALLKHLSIRVCVHVHLFFPYKFKLQPVYCIKSEVIQLQSKASCWIDELTVKKRLQITPLFSPAPVEVESVAAVPECRFPPCQQ